MTDLQTFDALFWLQPSTLFFVVVYLVLDKIIISVEKVNNKINKRVPNKC